MRARFSPAPTGFLHVGSARSALFNWLLTRHSGGELLLRVEDTNAELYRPEYLDSMFRTLDWLGIGFDAKPVHQSRRTDLYLRATEHLLESGSAYRCDCSQDEVKERTAGNPKPGYDGHCRDRDVRPGPGVAVRFRVPDEGGIEFDDVIRGHLVFKNADLEDFVIERANGSPTFFVPNAVDDVDMGITHVVRGEDLINVTPRVLLIREALGHTERPVFAHLPLIVNAQGKKLSKRRDDVAVEQYRERGYLPEAMRNYLAVLGWGPKDGVEIRPIEEIVEQFRLEDVVPSPAFFDTKKLDHFNGEYIRKLAGGDFLDRTRPWLGEHAQMAQVQRLAPLAQERMTTLAEAPGLFDFLYNEMPVTDQASWEKTMKGDVAAKILDDAIAEYETAAWSVGDLHAATSTIADRHGLKLAKAQAPIRVAVMGKTVGLPLFDSLEVLGRETTLARLREARASLAG